MGLNFHRKVAKIYAKVAEVFSALSADFTLRPLRLIFHRKVVDVYGDLKIINYPFNSIFQDNHIKIH